MKNAASKLMENLHGITYGWDVRAKLLLIVISVHHGQNREPFAVAEPGYF